MTPARWTALLPALLLPLMLVACYEGKEVGECFDGKDNDADGQVDCADLGCEAYCSDDDGGDDDAGDDDGGDDDGGDDDADDDDTSDDDDDDDTADDDASDDDASDDDASDDDASDDDASDDDASDDDASDDDASDDDSSDDDSSDDDTGPGNTPIQDVQQGLVAEYTIVTIDGVVTTGLSDPYSTCGWKSFWVQDPAGGPYSGIMIGFDLALFPPNFSVTPGDAVTITGEYREYYDATELVLASPADYVVTGHPGALAPAALGDPCGPSVGEAYEGVLIQVSGLTVTQTVADLGFGEFEVNGCLRVDDFLFEHTPCSPADLGPDPPMGQAITSITAPLHYTYKEFKLVPDGAGAFQGWTP